MDVCVSVCMCVCVCVCVFHILLQFRGGWGGKAMSSNLHMQANEHANVVTYY